MAEQTLVAAIRDSEGGVALDAKLPFKATVANQATRDSEEGNDAE